jgi:hypothetical protein
MSSVRLIQERLMPQLTSSEALAALQMKEYFTFAKGEYDGSEANSNSQASMPAQINEGSFSCESASKTFVYKNGFIMLWLLTKPTTANDFYELAGAIFSQRGYYGNHIEVFDSRGGEDVNPEAFHQSLHEFYCDLLGDASRAGHSLAKEELIQRAVVDDDRVAASQLELKRIGCKDKNHVIYLPRVFQTLEDLEALGMALKSGGVGSYFRMEKPQYALQLSLALLKMVADFKIIEYNFNLTPEARVAKKLADKKLIATQGISSPVIEEGSDEDDSALEIEQVDAPALASVSPGAASTTSAELTGSDLESNDGSPASIVEVDKDKDKVVDAEGVNKKEDAVYSVQRLRI